MPKYGHKEENCRKTKQGAEKMTINVKEVNQLVDAPTKKDHANEEGVAKDKNEVWNNAGKGKMVRNNGWRQNARYNLVVTTITIANTYQVLNDEKGESGTSMKGIMEGNNVLQGDQGEALFPSGNG